MFKLHMSDAQNPHETNKLYYLQEKKIGNKSLVESKQITLKLVLIYRNHTLLTATT